MPPPASNGAQRASIALTLASGVGIPELQARVNELEEKAIKRAEMSEADKAFLVDLYTCFVEGGRLVAPESSKLMQRYLSRSSEALNVSSNLFVRSSPVQREMEAIRKQVAADLARDGKLKGDYASKSFYMGDPNYFDSIVGLSFGTIKARPGESRPDAVVIHWRAEVPWEWPTYESILKSYGNYHARSFPLPNASSILAGSQRSLRIDDGLGGYLPAIGLAKPFLAYSEWDEALSISATKGDTPGGSVAQPTFGDLPVGTKFYFLSDTANKYPWTKLTASTASNEVNTRQSTIATDAPVKR